MEWKKTDASPRSREFSPDATPALINMRQANEIYMKAEEGEWLIAESTLIPPVLTVRNVPATFNLNPDKTA